MAETAPAPEPRDNLWAGGFVPTDNSVWPLQPWDNPWVPTVPSVSDNFATYVSYPEKIRLTLSEVEVLREAARKDAKVRAALEKFRHHIEIEVDFPGPEDGEDKI